MSENIAITLGGRPFVGTGREMPTEGSSNAILLVNGPLNDQYDLVFTPNGASVADTKNILFALGGSVSDIRSFTDRDTVQLKEAGTALLTDIAVFQKSGDGGRSSAFR